MSMSSHDEKRTGPNPNSQLLQQAIIAGAGIALPPDVEIPAGMAAVLLLVPINLMHGKSVPQIQKDVGLPWHSGNGDGVWFDEFPQ